MTVCAQLTLIHPAPGLSDTFYEEQTWSDEQRPNVRNLVYIVT